MSAMAAPRVNPVGIVERPESWAAAPRCHGWPLRITALLVLAAFVAVSVATTVNSLTAYCLTTDASRPAPIGRAHL
jgi:hypothetical protein